ncbi:MAG: hypothetical protein DI536_27635 [Archangium gephyra]|uniref:LTD domain-containing protein n=1 Tax=Archangium gephyra TaxID=48 RepID=A0A2W5T078_9BACT|nr:MAG: hypothetical protein DI536_27635 [Archangium gephyra]
MLISEVQTRGSAGGNDEFIELFNPGPATVVFDSRWKLSYRSATSGTCGTNTDTDRYVGAGQIIPPNARLLITNVNTMGPFDGNRIPDGTYTLGVTDSGWLALKKEGTAVDVLCFAFDSVTLSNVSTCPCEGTPATNPHDNSTATNMDTSLTRNGAMDTQNNVADFTAAASTPQGLTP